MSLTHSNSFFFGLRPVLLSIFIIVTIVETACMRDKPVAQNAATSGSPHVGMSGVGVAVTVDGRTVDDRDTTISLNPCKGETPSNVLGISAQAEVTQRVTAFTTKLRDPDPKVRACAARQLGYIGPEAKEALPHLIERMRDEEHDGVSVNISQALWAIGPDTKSTVDEWLESIRAEDANIRLYAAFALGYYKPRLTYQKAVVSALASSTRDKDERRHRPLDGR